MFAATGTASRGTRARATERARERGRACARGQGPLRFARKARRHARASDARRERAILHCSLPPSRGRARRHGAAESVRAAREAESGRQGRAAKENKSGSRKRGETRRRAAGRVLARRERRRQLLADGRRPRPSAGAPWAKTQSVGASGARGGDGLRAGGWYRR